MNTSSNDMEETVETPSKRGRNRAVAAGLAIGLVGGGAAGLVFGVPGLTSAAGSAVVVQQVDPTVPDTTDGTTTPPADNQAPAEAPDGTHLREALQPLVDAGTITAAQADAVVTQLQSSRPDRGGFGEGRMGHRGGPGEFGHGPMGQMSAAVTDLLKLDAQTLMTELRGGKTLAEIATAQSVDPQKLIDTIVAEAKTRLDQAVTDGRIDQTKADEQLAELTTRITDMVNNGRPERGGPGDGPGQGPGDGPAGSPTDAPPTTTD
jgi:hypothetical protein